jgi:hypothetical protein
MSTYSGSPRCWASTRLTALCCAATPARSANWPQARPLPSPGSRHGCGPPSGAHRRCGLTGRWPGSSPRSPARAAGWPAATPGRSGRSPRRWPDTRPRPSSRSCAPCGPSSGSRLKRGWPAPLRLRRSRRCHPASRPGSRRYGTRPTSPGSWRQSTGATRAGSDYAIIMLVARLGLRTIDVKRLEFADFDWPANRLSVAQAKTGREVHLPLLKENRRNITLQTRRGGSVSPVSGGVLGPLHRQPC